MPSIRPISDLRNYSEVLSAAEHERVYLTRNGRGAFAILSMAELDELDRRTAFAALQQEAYEAQREAEREGWISAEQIRRETAEEP